MVKFMWKELRRVKREYQYTKMWSKYYKKGEHKKLNGLCVFFEGKYVDENGKIQEDFVVLNNKDLFIQSLKKLQYFRNK